MTFKISLFASRLPITANNRNLTNNKTNSSESSLSTEQSAQAMNFVSSRIVKKPDEPPVEKTPQDFLREVLKNQPVSIDDNNKSKIKLVMKADKKAAEMAFGDYNMAFRRAVYGKALDGLKLSDDEIRLADKALTDAGLYSPNYDLRGTTESLRQDQRKIGDAMPVSVGRENIEYARRAGQAILQYQQYTAEQSDATNEKPRREVNQMFADPGRIVWNSVVNIVEGTINSTIDFALSKSGQDPLYNSVPDIAKPHVNFSGVKSDYRSEMMRRDINGKIDGDGIKAGQFIETGVTILAPLVVGAAITPSVAPQSLKTLGGIPEVEAVSSVSNTIKATADIRKFNEYIFTENSKGKDVVFRDLGYSEKDSVRLTEIWQKQASEKFANGEFNLGKKDKWGQRIDIEIKLEGVGQAKGKVSYMKSGWMLNDNGSISLNTPFSGFTK